MIIQLCLSLGKLVNHYHCPHRKHTWCVSQLTHCPTVCVEQGWEDCPVGCVPSSCHSTCSCRLIYILPGLPHHHVRADVMDTYQAMHFVVSMGGVPDMLGVPGVCCRVGPTGDPLPLGRVVPRQGVTQLPTALCTPRTSPPQPWPVPSSCA